jgi:flagellar biosynthesis protein FlhB
MAKKKISKKMEKSPVFKKKVKKVMREAAEGELHSGSKSGPIVTNPKQKIAIALSEGKKAVSKKKRK